MKPWNANADRIASLQAEVEQLKGELADARRDLAERMGAHSRAQAALRGHVERHRLAKAQAERDLAAARQDAAALRDQLTAHDMRLRHCIKVFASLRVLPAPFYAPTKGWLEFVPPDPLAYLRALQNAVLSAIKTAEDAAIDAARGKQGGGGG